VLAAQGDAEQVHGDHVLECSDVDFFPRGARDHRDLAASNPNLS